MTSKTFLLGAGCQKGGTTWLQGYLAAAPECAPGWGTEYHVFDSMDLPEHAWVLTGIAKRARAAIDAVAAGRLAASGNDLHRLAMIAEPDFYYDYFTSLLAPRDIRLTMDITPNYAMLSSERLSEILEGFEARGVRAVSVFLMRDPVERIWSHVRMQKQRRPLQHHQPEHVLVEQRFAQDPFELRTRYEHTVRRLDDTFGTDKVHYDFYETLFDDDHLRALTEFLGLPHRAADLDHRLNASPKSAEALPEALVHRVVNHFRDTYEFVRERFDAELETVWPNVRYLD